MDKRRGELILEGERGGGDRHIFCPYDDFPFVGITSSIQSWLVNLKNVDRLFFIT